MGKFKFTYEDLKRLEADTNIQDSVEDILICAPVMRTLEEHFAGDKIKELISDDWDEVEKCLKSKAHKASIALISSVLECILLCWLDYKIEKGWLTDNREQTLGNLIKAVEESNKLNRTIITKAKEINWYRKFIHPKRYLKENVELNDDVCKSLTEKLQYIANNI